MTNEDAARLLEDMYIYRTRKIPSRYKPTKEALKKAIEALKQNKALLLLVDWAIECGFGYDNIPEEYEKNKQAIERKGLGYTEGLLYIAEQEAADD